MTATRSVLTGLWIYIRFGGWLILPIVFLAAVQDANAVALAASAATVLTFSYAIGTDYNALPDAVKPARLLDVIP